MAMNIKQAKQEIRNTLRAYLSKDDLGNYLIPPKRQRPVLLMGPPGSVRPRSWSRLQRRKAFR